MYNHAGFEPYLIGERNRQIFEEVRALWLEKQLRKHREGSGSRPATLILRLKGALHLLRGAGLAGR